MYNHQPCVRFIHSKPGIHLCRSPGGSHGHPRSMPSSPFNARVPSPQQRQHEGDSRGVRAHHPPAPNQSSVAMFAHFQQAANQANRGTPPHYLQAANHPSHQPNQGMPNHFQQAGHQANRGMPAHYQQQAANQASRGPPPAHYQHTPNQHAQPHHHQPYFDGSRPYTPNTNDSWQQASRAQHRPQSVGGYAAPGSFVPQQRHHTNSTPNTGNGNGRADNKRASVGSGVGRSNFDKLVNGNGSNTTTPVSGGQKRRHDQSSNSAPPASKKHKGSVASTANNSTPGPPNPSGAGPRYKGGYK